MKYKAFFLSILMTAVILIIPSTTASAASEDPIIGDGTPVEDNDSCSKGTPGVRDGLILDGGAVFLMSDGTVRAIQDERLSAYYSFFDFPLTDCENWTEITQLQRCNDVIAALRKDGTVVATGREDHAEEISKWDHMIELYGLTGDFNAIAGLRDDGRVLIVGEDPQPNMDTGVSTYFEGIKALRNVKKLVIGTFGPGGYAAALHNDGAVTYGYDDWSGPTEHIADLDCYGWDLIALRENGTCVVNGLESYRYSEITNTWTDLKQVLCYSYGNVIGLREDGTVVAAGDQADYYSDEFVELSGIDRLERGFGIAAYRKDGTAEWFRDYCDSGNEEVRSWTGIKKILAAISVDMEPVIIGIKTDGSLVSTVGEIRID